MPVIAEQLTGALKTLEKHYELSASLGAAAHPELVDRFHKATTRIYDEAVARDILPVMPIFIGKVRQLLETQRRQSDAPA